MRGHFFKDNLVSNQTENIFIRFSKSDMIILNTVSAIL